MKKFCKSLFGQVVIAPGSGRGGGARIRRVGNCVGTVVIGAWEGDVDYQRAHDVLDGRVTVDLRDSEREADEPLPDAGLPPVDAPVRAGHA
ncbi:hypothetical protein [Castellaniella caeni]|uniref:hypothetical protein n=1 Tax=Castellaniella caeni TaxID=266123 RepID=UPI000C9FBA33